MKRQSEKSEPQTRSLRANSLGTPSIVFLVVAFAAPEIVVVTNMPLQFGFGNGIGTTGTFLIAGLVLLCFVAGYSAMSRDVSDAGAFYAYVTKGLGRVPGVVVALVAVVTYTILSIALLIISGYFAGVVIDDVFGLQWHWAVWALIALAVCAVSGYREVQVSTRVVGVFLIISGALMVMQVIGALLANGVSSFTLKVFSPAEVFSGSPGIAFVFAFLSFVGIEATAIFQEEARDAERTVPRASYLAVGLITLFYVITSWSYVSIFSADDVGAIAAQDPGNFAFIAMNEVLGEFAQLALQIEVVLGLLAMVIVAHNATNRYMFSLGRAKLLPQFLAATHAKTGSPYVASVVQIGITLCVIIPLMLTSLDAYLDLAAPLLGLATLGIVALQCVTALAVLVHFQRQRSQGWWKGLIAPLVATLGLAMACVLILRNFSLITGKESAAVAALPWLLVVTGILGLVVALVQNRRNGAEQLPERVSDTVE